MRLPEVLRIARFAMTLWNLILLWHRLSTPNGLKENPRGGSLAKHIQLCADNLHKAKLQNSSWIDATTAFVYVRSLAVPLVLEHLHTCPLWHFHNNRSTAVTAKRCLIKLFQLIKDSIELQNHGDITLPGRPSNSGKKEELRSCFSDKDDVLLLGVQAIANSGGESSPCLKEAST